ncbi:MAG: hypothetical protein ACI9MR_002562, partial [Myxococcota bacterium]
GVECHMGRDIWVGPVPAIKSRVDPRVHRE